MDRSAVHGAGEDQPVNWRDVDVLELDLELLTPSQQRAVLLTAAGLSQRATAQHMNITRGTLRDHLAAAAHRLGLTGET